MYPTIVAAVNSRAPLNHPAARGLRDYSSLYFDLLRVNQYLGCRARLPTVTDFGPDLFTRAALWDASVVVYGRCFAQGRRAGLHGMLSKLPDPLRMCHEQIITARNKQTAHHGEDAYGFTTVDAEFTDAGLLLGVRVEQFPRTGPDTEPPFQELINALATLVEAKMDRSAASALRAADVNALQRTAAAGQRAPWIGTSPVRLTYLSWGQS